MVIERLKVDISIDIDLTIVRDRITQSSTVFALRTTYPVVGGIIAGISCHPVHDRQFVQWQLIAGSECLAIVQGCSEMRDTVPYRVLPRRITVRIEVFVDGQVAVGFFHFCLCA